MRRLLFVAMSAVLMAVGLGALTPVSASTTQDFGSVAYSASTGVAASNVGYNKAEALAGAEKACKDQGGAIDCQAVAWFRNSYGSFARSSGGDWGWGWGTTSATADKFALFYCNQQGTKDCKVIKTERTASAAITSLAAGNSVAPLHGNWSVGGFPPGDHVNHGDHVGRDYWAVDFLTNNPKLDSNLAVYPVKPGVVVWSKYDCSVVGDQTGKGTSVKPCYGNTVVIDHGNGLSSIYTHLAPGSIPPQTNIKVTTDTRIGTMSDNGCTGCGVHLHFAMHSGSMQGSILYGAQLKSVQTPWRWYGSGGIG